jgi:hypothetical protein
MSRPCQDCSSIGINSSSKETFRENIDKIRSNGSEWVPEATSLDLNTPKITVLHLQLEMTNVGGL